MHYDIKQKAFRAVLHNVRLGSEPPGFISPACSCVSPSCHEKRNELQN